MQLTLVRVLAFDNENGLYTLFVNLDENILDITSMHRFEGVMCILEVEEG